MKEHLKKAIELLKNRVHYNLERIHENERKVRNILQEPVSSDRSGLLEEKFNINKKMLEENNESINIQLGIIKFLGQFDNQLDGQLDDFGLALKSEETNTVHEKKVKQDNAEKETLSKDDYFELIINKSIDFDDSNPYFNDKEFGNQLIEYFTDIEDYEMCSKLIVNHKKL